LKRLLCSVGIAAASAVAFACGSGGDTPSIDGTPSGASSSGSTGGSTVGNGGSVVSFGGGGTNGSGSGTGSGGFNPDDACVGEAAEGELMPVDLYFMVDITGSMKCPVPDSRTSPCEVDPGPPYASTTRWVVESAALKSFMSSPANAGLGVGIGFFPSASNLCDASSYTRPAVEIAALPGAASALNAAIDAQSPAGNTPTVASLTGALDHAQSWATAHPGRNTAVVYATDGYPRSCGAENTIRNAAAVARAAFDATPAIRTYVLGVGQNLSDLNDIAVAGGTDRAYLVDTSGDAATQLSAALDSIRVRSRAGCIYSIPAPPTGRELDYQQVNVRYTSSSGEVIDAAKDPSLDECNEGWQYSADKSQIQLCGELCTAVQSDPGGKLNILFGCATNVNPPR